MYRLLPIFGLIGASFFAAPMAAAQDHEVWVDLFALAQFPLLREDQFLRYPTGPSEYKRLTRWNLDKWRDRSPEYFDLVAIVQNPGTLPGGSIELRLTRDRKIGERRLWLSSDPEPQPRELAQWEGPIPVQTKTIGTLGADAATSVWFGPFSADELWQDFREQESWPWEVRYEVTLRCAGCSPATGSASFDMVFPH